MLMKKSLILHEDMDINTNIRFQINIRNLIHVNHLNLNTNTLSRYISLTVNTYYILYERNVLTHQK